MGFMGVVMECKTETGTTEFGDDNGQYGSYPESLYAGVAG